MAQDRQDTPAEPLDAETVVTSLPHPLFVIGPDDRFRFANAAAEAFFGLSGAVLAQRTLARLITGEAPLLNLINLTRKDDSPFADQSLSIDGPEITPRLVDASSAPVAGAPGTVVVLLREKSVAARIGQPSTRATAMRSVTGMAETLAHEIKNPLSGIRGAAQLLQTNLGPDDAPLAELIREEVDRIALLVDRMDIFSEHLPPEMAPVNIHEVLGHVCRVARAGFAADVKIIERYDPSLPMMYADRAQLIQAFLNLVKNASEATGGTGRITLTTAYRHDLQRVGPEGRTRPHLPLEVSVEDNGPGIPEDMIDTLFEPFVTSRADGTGLGLAVVAKIAADHGASIECRSNPGLTVFITRWAMAPEAAAEAGPAPPPGRGPQP